VSNLFPHLPAHLIAEALDHPTFAVHPLTLIPEEAAAPLIDAILIGSTAITPELGLREALEDTIRQGTSDTNVNTTSANGLGIAVKPVAPVERRNIWDTETLDMSRLKLGNDES
jgi:hypothetical protein